ncbi:MAG TPA: hypothetical protein VF358_04830 [Syntrophales bacterium]
MKVPPCPFDEIVGKIKMLSMEVRTSLSTEELADRLNEFFEQGGLGLELKEVAPGRLTFTGGGGTVTVTFRAEGGKTLLKIVTSGWVVPAKKFIDNLP